MIQRVAVIGAGTMGLGIAQLCAQAGFSVKVHDAAAASLETLPKRLKTALDSAVLKGKLSTMQADRAFQSVSAAASLDELAGADLVIEAVVEDLGVKQALFEKVSRVCPDAVLATNTSSLPVSRILERADVPERGLGMHFFNPPVAMKLVEMIRGERTAPQAFKEAWDFVLLGLRRTPVDAKDKPGFIVNRVMRPYYVSAQRPSAGGKPFPEVDEACRTSGGVPMGPFELMDLIGLDVNLSITQSIWEALGRPERFAPPAAQQALVAQGALGRKAGRGFYLYEGGKRAGVNPDAARLLPAAAPWDALKAALMAEAELVVAEGTTTPGDVDVAVKLAMNFPKGPFEWRRESTAAKR